MRFDFKIPVIDISAELPIRNFLLLFAERDFNAADHGHRHPIGIFNRALERVSNSIDATLRSLGDYLARDKGDESSARGLKLRLVEEIERVFYAGEAYFDDCRSIVFLFGETLGENKGKKFKRDYDDTVREARDFVAVAANEMKHKQSRIQILVAGSEFKETIGFFFDGIEENGATGPNPIVHRGGKTAYSFNRAMRQILVSILYAQAAMLAILEPKFGRSTEKPGLGRLGSIAEEVAKLPHDVFWDEVCICPSVDLSDKLFEITTKDHHKFIPPQDPGRINVEYPAEDVPMTLSLPYVGRDTRPGKYREKFTKAERK